MSRSRITQKTIMDGVTISSETKYSDPVRLSLCTGSASMIVKSTAGTLEILQQCSLDGKNWYDPVDTSGASHGLVAIAQLVTTGSYIIFRPVVAEWTRFKITESTASTVVTLTLIIREEVS